MHIRNKEALHHGRVLKKVYLVIKFSQKPWLKLYIDINTELRIKSKTDFERGFQS